MGEKLFDIRDVIAGDIPTSLGDFSPHGSLEDQAAAANAKNYDTEVREIAELTRITACFRTPDGRVFMEWLRLHTIELPHFFPYDYSGNPHAGPLMQLNAEQQGFVREGQDMVYRQIVEMMARVDEGVLSKPPPSPQPE